MAQVISCAAASVLVFARQLPQMTQVVQALPGNLSAKDPVVLYDMTSCLIKQNIFYSLVSVNIKLVPLMQIMGTILISLDQVMRTYSYLAPEYAASGKPTETSDVISFGVVLLQLITGSRPVDRARPFVDDRIVEWARPLLTQALEAGRFSDIVDQD
ncbi:hypothetical protein SOVF_037030 [Spinacia oleracea]|nr:hypothetical protein SOVF_037030 [Spinacia oleracea]